MSLLRPRAPAAAAPRHPILPSRAARWRFGDGYQSRLFTGRLADCLPLQRKALAAAVFGAGGASHAGNGWRGLSSSGRPMAAPSASSPVASSGARISPVAPPSRSATIGGSSTPGPGGPAVRSCSPRYAGEAIYRVSTSGGKPVAIVKPDRARGETKVTWPWFLPDGKSFLYHVRAGGQLRQPDVFPARRALPARSSRCSPGSSTSTPDISSSFARARSLPSASTLEAAQFRASPFRSPIRSGYFLSHGAGGLRDLSQRRARVSDFRHSSRPGVRMSWLDRAGRLVETLGPTGDLGRDRHRSRRPQGSLRALGPEEPDQRPLDLRPGAESRDARNVRPEPMSPMASGSRTENRSCIPPKRGGLLQLGRRELATGREEALLPARGMQLPKTSCPGARSSRTRSEATGATWM